MKEQLKIIDSKKRLTPLLYSFLLLLPFIDVITSLMAFYSTNIVTIGMFLKTLLIVIGYLYIFTISKSKYKKVSKLFFFAFTFYLSLYFLFKPELLSLNYVFLEVKYLLKFFYFPLIYFVLLCVFDDNGFNSKEVVKIFRTTLIFYVMIFCIAFLTNTGFSAYKLSNSGFNGWFYAANEVGAIFVLLFTFIFINDKKRDGTLKYLLLLMGTLFASMISTKVVLIGITLVLLLEIILIFYKRTEKLEFKKLFYILVSILILYYGPSALNFKERLHIERTMEKDEVYETDVSFTNQNKYINYFLRMLSDRDVLFMNTLSIARNNDSLSTKMFGLGFSNTKKIQDKRIEKLIEIDFFDFYFHLGIVSLVLIILPLIISVAFLYKKKLKLSEIKTRYLYVAFLMIGISLFAGHIFTTPTIGIYYSLLLFLIMDDNESSKLNFKKVDILALHLNYGGIETSIVSQANILSEKYEVNLVALYKKDEHKHSLKGDVNVIYLTNVYPNKKELLLSIQSKNSYKILQEVFKSLKVLYKKHTAFNKYLLNTEAGFIISSRMFITDKLNKHGPQNAVKIAEEHTYNVSDKYMAKYNKMNQINHLITVSKHMKKIYSDKITNINIKYIPNSLDVMPKEQETSKLNKYNLIAIGRLEPEKSFMDLIELFKILKLKNKNYHLDLFGDGSERPQIEEKISEYNLSKYITLHGFQDRKTISNYLKKSSMYVMTSLEESFGIVLLEAMSFGVPCIAFDSAVGATEIINKSNGFLIKNRNIKDMAEKINEYILMKNKEEYFHAARKTAANYHIDVIKKEFFELLENGK